ncbi:alcohol dehydrogenase catalytic domain-containing protein [Micrococcales bacterium 31B]|nr:alcohol dehydrogenase catalytic domain-containing protein [Micrococcales bacterium 31B]
MRALELTAPFLLSLRDVPEPVAGPGEVVIRVERVGLCGTDMEFFRGEMRYLETGDSRFPLRLGHEWCGTVSGLGPGVDAAWLGRRVTGDTMLGCGGCARCRDGRQHVCDARREVGIKGGWHGALAESLLMPVSALVTLPDSLDPAVGALIEPAGNALRAARALGSVSGQPCLVLGPGTIGLLTAMFLEADGAEAHVLGPDSASLAAAHRAGFEGRAWTPETLPRLTWAGVVDASTGAEVPAQAVDLVEPGRRVALIGLAGEPSLLDTREAVRKDVTLVGILSASPGIHEAARLLGDGTVDPRPLIAATIPLEEVAQALEGRRANSWPAAPKVLIDPRLRA